jgi:hypothetical protein
VAVPFLLLRTECDSFALSTDCLLLDGDDFLEADDEVFFKAEDAEGRDDAGTGEVRGFFSCTGISLLDLQPIFLSVFLKANAINRLRGGASKLTPQGQGVNQDRSRIVKPTMPTGSERCRLPSQGARRVAVLALSIRLQLSTA